jgi:hypothetical protein
MKKIFFYNRTFVVKGQTYVSKYFYNTINNSNVAMETKLGENQPLFDVLGSF